MCILYTIFDLQGAKDVLYRANDESNFSINGMEWIFVTHVRFAEIGTLPTAILLFIFGISNGEVYNLWDNDNVAVLLTYHWLFNWVHVPFGIFISFFGAIVIGAMYLTTQYAFPTFDAVYDL